MADKYNISKAMIVEYWQIGTLPDSIGQSTDRLGHQHLYALSQLANKEHYLNRSLE